MIQYRHDERHCREEDRHRAVNKDVYFCEVGICFPESVFFVFFCIESPDDQKTLESFLDNEIQSVELCLHSFELRHNSDKQPCHELSNRKIQKSECKTEIQKINTAFVTAEKQLDRIIRNENTAEESKEILEAHIEILNDPALHKRVTELIENDLYCCEDALLISTDEFAALLEKLDDEYMRERANDIRDIDKRIYKILCGIEEDIDLSEEVIIVADDLTPSTLSALNRKYIKAIISGTGGQTSHIAIMANCMLVLRHYLSKKQKSIQAK